MKNHTLFFIRQHLLTFIFFSCFFTKVNASHIVGGDFTYHWMTGNKYELELKLYRDCNTNVAFDANITIGFFDKGTNQKIDTLVMFLSATAPVVLSGPSASCITPIEVCVEQGIYRFVKTLPSNPDGYYIVWERCCRNATIVNIDNPVQTGLAFYVEMPDPALHNSSPVFTNDPLPFMCAGQPLNYSFAATDADGDQLRYELVNPLAGNIGYPTNPPVAILNTPMPGPYASVLWNPGYSLANVCGSSVNPLAVDPVTGTVTVTADNSGIYAMAILVHELRGGVEIGLIRREIEFSVIVCPNSPPQLDLASAQNFTANNFLIYETDSVCFTASATDNTDSVYIHYSGEIFQGGSIGPPYATASTDSGLNEAASVFCWKTKCGHARVNPYKVVYTVYDNGCPLPATSVDTIKINVQPAPVIEGINILCIGLRNNTSTELFWADTSSAPARFFKQYNVYRSKNGAPYVLMGSVTDHSVTSYEDNTASDYLNNDYCYYVKAVNSCGVIGASSDTLCTLTQINTKTNYIKQVSIIDDGKIEMQWKHFPDGPYSTFSIYRKENGASANYTLRASLQNPNYDSWIDNDVLTAEKSYCYYLVNEDYCGNVSPQSNEACTILLKGNSKAYENDVEWSRYAEWGGGTAQFQLFRKPVNRPDYSLLHTQPDSILNYRDIDLDINSGQFNYYVKAIEDTGSLDGVSFSNEITLNQVPVGFLPSGFTPNGDAKNDTWGLSSSFVKDFELRVYTRWGTLVFYSSNKQVHWNGMYNGNKAAAGTYVYTLRYTGYDSDDVHEKTGTVTLIR